MLRESQATCLLVCSLKTATSCARLWRVSLKINRTRPAKHPECAPQLKISTGAMLDGTMQAIWHKLGDAFVMKKPCEGSMQRNSNDLERGLNRYAEEIQRPQDTWDSASSKSTEHDTVQATSVNQKEPQALISMPNKRDAPKLRRAPGTDSYVQAGLNFFWAYHDLA